MTPNYQYQISHIYDEFLVTPGSKSQEENNLATLQLHRVAVFPVVIASHSSSVEKDGSLHRNVHKILSGIL